jgi:hypothetical protein
MHCGISVSQYDRNIPRLLLCCCSSSSSSPVTFFGIVSNKIQQDDSRDEIGIRGEMVIA